ncbi:MAG: calcium/sodium antiporter [Paludibacteraceae bacterium]|nr:calcium/sodium antiporter [Paludibacteraceae bacterium]
MFGFLDTWLSVSPWIGVALIVVGFVALVKGADWLVDGASALAKRFGISDLVIGLTVVAFGTSMPEFVVNMVSVADGSTDLAITNILGSNIINTFVILGLTAVVYPVVSQRTSRILDIPMATVAGILVLVFAWTGGIGRWEAVVLLVMFVIYMVVTILKGKKKEEENKIAPKPVWKAMLLIVLGLCCLVVGGELIVKCAVQIATDLGVSEAIIGLTIVALGTSLPELATSVVAAARKNSDIALGNVLGSNIFNVFFVLGVSGVIRTLPAYDGFIVDSLMVALGCLLVWVFVQTNSKKEVKRWEGAFLLIVYAGYLTYRLMTL